MSLMPEEIPIVLTVFLTLGAWRMSRRNVLTRQVAAIENLGSATVLCTDKTGTLTLNRMTVTKLYSGGETIDVTAADSAIRSGDNRVSRQRLRRARLRPPIRWNAPSTQPQPTMACRALDPPLRVYGLSPELLAVTFVRRAETRRAFDVAAKGAPEAILSLCSIDERGATGGVGRDGQDGRRRVACPCRRRSLARRRRCRETPRGFAFEFLGLVGLSDPVRDTVPAAVAECRQAGIRVIMITGDYPVDRARYRPPGRHRRFSRGHHRTTAQSS